MGGGGGGEHGHSEARTGDRTVLASCEFLCFLVFVIV